MFGLRRLDGDKLRPGIIHVGSVIAHSADGTMPRCHGQITAHKVIREGQHKTVAPKAEGMHHLKPGLTHKLGRGTTVPGLEYPASGEKRVMAHVSRTKVLSVAISLLSVPEMPSPPRRNEKTSMKVIAALPYPRDRWMVLAKS